MALVAVAGQEVALAFLTNNLEGRAARLGAGSRCRWQLAGFCQPIKPPLRLADFLGPSANAGRWQVGPARLGSLGLRDWAFLSAGSQRWRRLFTLGRGALWKQWAGLNFLRRAGTADGHFRCLARPAQACLPGWG